MPFYRKSYRPRRGGEEPEKCADPAKARARALDALASREMSSAQLYERLCYGFTEQAAAAAVAEMVDDMSVFDVIRLPDLYHNLKAAIKTVVAGETPAHVFFDNAEIDGQKMLSIVSD